MTYSQLMIHRHDFEAEQFCRVKRSIAFPEHSSFADCRFNVHLESSLEIEEKLFGPGVYAICYERRLIYIGKYLGQKRNPFAGNIARLRWVQHLGSMTMRDRRVSLSKRALDKLLHPDFSNRHDALIESLAHAFENKNADGSTKPFLYRDRGCVSTLNRVLFALEHWPSFSQADGPLLEGFSFHYFRVEKETSELPTENLRTLVSTLEDHLVEAFRPACNGIIDPGTALPFSWPQVLDDLHEKIKRFLSAKVQPSSDKKPVSKPISSTQKAYSDGITSEPEEISAEARFFERLESAPPQALAFVDRLRSYASERDDIELHFTNTDGGDLRLRRHGLGQSKRRSQNFVTVVWQVRDQTFRINNLCRLSGAHIPAELFSIVCFRENDPLKYSMKIDAQTALAEKKTLIGWIDEGRLALTE